LLTNLNVKKKCVFLCFIYFLRKLYVEDIDHDLGFVVCGGVFKDSYEEYVDSLYTFLDI